MPAYSLIPVPIPTGDGVGAAVNISNFDPLKAFLIAPSAAGVSVGGSLIVEISCDPSGNTNRFVAVARVDIKSVIARDPVSYVGPANWVRIRRFGTPAITDPFPPSMAVGGNVTSTNVYQALTVPTTDGAGTALDISQLGYYKAIHLGDSFENGTLFVELSPDGVAWQTAFRFNGPCNPSKTLLPITFQGDYNQIRIRRIGARDGITPTAWLGTGEESSLVEDVAASWDPSLVRYFFVSNDAGLDTSVGFIDAAPDTVFTPAQVAAVAIKTSTRLKQIFPKFLNGRIAVVLIQNRANGATYKKPDGITDDDFDWTGVCSDRYLLRRGATTMLNDTADRIQAGYITASAGPNADGSWTVAAGTTVSIINIAAGALPAEPAIVGVRVRFKGNVTAGLANQCRNINANAAGNLTLGVPSTLAGAVGDEFFIEEPGVRFALVRECDSTSSTQNKVDNTIASNTTGTAVMVGIVSTTTATGGFQISAVGGFCSYVGCGSTGVTNNAHWGMKSNGAFGVNIAYVVEGGGSSVIVGTGWRSATGAALTGAFTCSGTAIALVSATATITVRCLLNQASGFFNGGSYLGNGAFVTSLQPPGDPIGNTLGTGGIGSIGTNVAKLRTLNIIRVGGSITIQNVDCTGCPSFGIQTATGQNGPANGGAYQISGVSGVVGGAVGFDFSALRNGIVFFDRNNPNTVTGSSGDMFLADSILTSHAAWEIMRIQDPYGNKYGDRGSLLVGKPGYTITKQFHNNDAAAGRIGDVVKCVSSKNGVPARANTNANASLVMGVWMTTPPIGGDGFIGDANELPVRMDAITAVNICYLSDVNAGQGRETPPPLAATNQKLRLGVTFDSATINAVLYGFVQWRPEILPVLSDGLP